jgi:hypothetical protein
MRTKWLPGIMALVLAMAPQGRAWGQGLTGLFSEGVPGYGTAPGVTVLSRARTGRDLDAHHAGAFLITPGLEQSVGYDDNVLSGASRRGSWMVGTRPSLLIASGWSRDAFGAYFSAADTRYPSQPQQSRTDGTASVGGAIDVGRDRLTLSAAHLSQHENRSELDALPADRPIAFRLDDARASYAAVFGRWTLTPEAEVSSRHYGDTTILGVPAGQAYRDRFMLRGGTTFRYEWAPLRNLVFVARALTQHYTAPVAGQPSLNSTGYQVLIGFDYDDDTVWRYRLLAGGETRQFASAAYQPHSAFIAEGELTWNPTALTTLRATLSRSIEDAAQEGVSGFTYTAGRLGIDHEMRRDWLISASAELRHAAYSQRGGQQSGHAVGAGLTWLANRSVRVSATYDLSGVRGAGPVSSAATGYSREVALLTLRLGL